MVLTTGIAVVVIVTGALTVTPPTVTLTIRLLGPTDKVAVDRFNELLLVLTTATGLPLLVTLTVAPVSERPDRFRGNTTFCPKQTAPGVGILKPARVGKVIDWAGPGEQGPPVQDAVIV